MMLVMPSHGMVFLSTDQNGSGSLSVVRLCNVMADCVKGNGV